MKLEDLEGYQGVKKFAEIGKGIMITLTLDCDCKCKHCGVQVYRRRGAVPLSTLEIKERIIDKMEDIGFKVLLLFGGEPTVHKDFFEIVKYATEKGLYLHIDTNGHKLSDLNFVKQLIDIAPKITFFMVSIDSANPEVHDRFRGVKGSWEMAVQGIKNCVRMGIPVAISTVATKGNLKNGDFKRIIQLGKELGVNRIRSITPIMIGRWQTQNVKLSREERKYFFSLLEPNFVFWEQFCDGTVPFVCSSIVRWYFFISLYGEVQPCCYVPISFGNVREEELKNIVERMWSSSYFSIERANINKCDCPMNDEYVRTRLLKMFTKTKEYPVDYDEGIFNSNI